MSSLQAIRAGKIAVEAGLDDSRLRRGLKATEKRLRAFGASVRNIGAQMAGMGAGMAAPFVAATKVFAGFEQQMARVKALTGATGADFNRLASRAKELGATTAFSAAQAAEAMGNYAQANFGVEGTLKAVGPTLDMAAVGMIEIADAAEIAIGIMGGMEIQAEDLAGVVDVMSKAMTTANTDLSELGAAFKFVGPLASFASVSLEEVTAGIQSLSDAGLRGEMAGTAMRGILQGLTSVTPAGAKVLRELGVQVEDVNGNFRGFIPIIKDFERGMAGMGNVEKLDKLSTLFGARAAGAAAKLIQQGGAGLEERTMALGDSAGTAAQIAAIQMDTLTGSTKIVLSALQGLAIEVGEAVAPSFRKFADRLIETLGIAATFVQNNKELIVIVAKVAAGLIAAGSALIGLGLAAKVAAFAMGTLGAMIGLVLSPLGLVIAGLAGAAYAFVQFSDTGKAAFASVSKTASDAFEGIAGALRQGDIELAGRILWLSLRVEFQKGIGAIRGIWVKGLNALERIWLDWGTALMSVLDNLVHAFSDAMLAIAGIMVKTVRRLTDLLIPYNDLIAATTGFDARAALKSGADSIDSLREDRDAAKASRQEARFLEAGEARRRLGEREAAAGADPELDRLQTALTRALNEARAVKVELDEEPGEGGRQPFVLPGIQPGAIESEVGRSAARTDISGSFSAAALRGLGAGDSAADRTAEASEEQVELLKSIDDRLRQGGGVFE